MRENTLLDLWTIALHEEFTEHKDAKSGLSKDCPRCREMAERLFAIQTNKLLEISLMEGEINFRHLAGKVN